MNVIPLIQNSYLLSGFFFVFSVNLCGAMQSVRPQDNSITDLKIVERCVQFSLNGDFKMSNDFKTFLEKPHSNQRDQLGHLITLNTLLKTLSQDDSNRQVLETLFKERCEIYSKTLMNRVESFQDVLAKMSKKTVLEDLPPLTIPCSLEELFTLYGRTCFLKSELEKVTH